MLRNFADWALCSHIKETCSAGDKLRLWQASLVASSAGGKLCWGQAPLGAISAGGKLFWGQSSLGQARLGAISAGDKLWWQAPAGSRLCWGWVVRLW